MLRPFVLAGFGIHKNDTMHMIWHYHKCIQRYVRKMFGDSCPAFADYRTGRVFPHFIIFDLAEEETSFVRADCHEIGAGGGIIIVL